MKRISSVLAILLIASPQGVLAAQRVLNHKPAPDTSPECQKIMDDCLKKWQDAAKPGGNKEACVEACNDKDKKCSERRSLDKNESDAQFIHIHKRKCGMSQEQKANR